MKNDCQVDNKCSQLFLIYDANIKQIKISPYHILVPQIDH